MGRPAPKVLFSQSFRHYHPGEHVDEVRFSEPVVITACEILEQQTNSLCRSLLLSGASSPQSFSIEIFVRSVGDARFKRLCHAFIYSSSAPALLDAQVAVTDHLVLRGTYDSLTLVVYGNLASQIGQVSVDCNLGSELPDLLASEISCRFEDLPEALHPQRAKVGPSFGPLKYLHLIKTEKKNAELIQKVLQLTGQTGLASFDTKSMHKIVKSLVSAAASLHISESRLPNVSCFDFWPAFSKPNPSEESEQKKELSLLLDAKQDLSELLGLPPEKEEDKTGGYVLTVEESEEMEQDGVKEKLENSDSVLELILHWIQSSVQLRDLQTPALLSVERLIGGLAAAQLLCTDARECYRFVLAGGLHILLDVLQHVVGNFSATTLLALGAVECASRYAFGCDALLGWWTPNTALCRESLESRGTCKGYSVLLKFLLQPQQRPIVLLAARVLHRLRVYELTAAIQPIAENFMKEPASLATSPREEESKGKAIDKSAVLIKQILILLTAREVSVKEGPSTRFSHWLALDGEDGGNQLPPSAAYGAIPSTTSIISRQDIDPYLLSVLQERRLLPMLVALLSAPRLRSLQGQAMRSCTELVGAVETLLLALLSCRSGLLFLAHDPEVSRNLFASFQRIQELHEKDLPPLRHAMALTTAGFLCHPHDLGGMFQTCLSVISAIDRLLGARQQSEESLWALWELCTISRLESGRQALLMLTWFPEVMTLLVGSFHSGSEGFPGLAFGKTWRGAAVHFVAEVLQVVVSDAAAPTVAAWTPHAVGLQRAILASSAEMDESLSSSAGGYEIKNGACSGLLEWLDSAVVYHKKGAVGLLKHASAILAGGLPSLDAMEVDGNVGDQAVNNDLVNAAGPYQAKWAGTEVTASPLTEGAIVQMTVAFRILALVSCYPGVATVLYGEGAMAVVFSVLDQCSTALQLTSSTYDATMDEEDMEFDVTAENVGDHEKEHLLLGLMLPSLLFLLALLQNLQAAVRNYQNTKLVDVLLLLHQQMSSRIASYVSAPPYAWSGITQDFVAVRQVLASVLVCWPTFGWTPPLFPRLLGLDTSSTLPNPALPPMEPAATCSVLSLLVDMLPTESPQPCNSKSSLSDMYRSLAVDNVLGCQSASAIRWHTRSPRSDEFIQAFVLYLDQIGEVVTQNTSTVCGVLRDMLKLLIIRLACLNADHAATILRPIISQIRDQSTPITAASEMETLQVEHAAQIIAGLALHPASKAVLLREAVVEVLLNACKFSDEPFIGDESASSEIFNSAALRQWLWTARAFTALCDPDISLVPSRPLSRRIMEDCPNFGHCCSIVSWLLNLLQVLPIGKDFDVVLEALKKLSSHKMGRTAVGYASVRGQDMTTAIEEVTTDSGKSQVGNDSNYPEVAKEKTEEPQSSIFGGLWQRIQGTMESDKCDGIVLVDVIRRFAKLAIMLSAAGKSACGVAALGCLFGMGKGFPADQSSEDKLGSVVSIAASLRKYIVEDGPDRIPATGISCLSSVPGPIIQEAYSGLMTILRILKRPEIGKEMIEKAILDIKRQTVAYNTQKTNCKRVEWRPDGRLCTALVLSTNPHVEYEKDESNSDECPPEKGSEASGLDPRGVLVWECSVFPQDRPVMPRSSSKRKSMAMIEVSRKRPGMDTSAALTPPVDGMPTNNIGSTPVSGRPLPTSATLVSALNRRDTFRQRKPNTSRPPSMHVDDYVARERSEVVTSGSSPAPIQRSTSGSGRPPSIHVDEFMAKQQERQQLSATNSGIDDHHLSRNSSLPALDSGRKGHLVSAKATNKMSEEDGQRSTTPQDKGLEQHWEELSVAESAAVVPGVRNENREASHRSASAPYTTADVKSEKTSSSSSSISTTTDSVHSAKTPQVADMLLLQSKVTLQTSVARNLAGVVQTQKEEVVQIVSGLAAGQVHLRDTNRKVSGTSTAHAMSDKKASIPFHPWPSEPQLSSRAPGSDRPAVTPPSTNEKTSEFQVTKNVQATTGFSPPADLQARDSSTLIRGMDAQNPGHLSVREPRHLPSPSVHSTRQTMEPTTPAGPSIEANVLTKPSPFAMPHHGSQPMQMNSPMAVLEHRSLLSTLVTEPSRESGKGVVSSSYATDPRPRPPGKHGERTATDVSRQVVPPPASPWHLDAVQSRLESTLPSPLATLVSTRPGASPYPTLAGPAPQWPPGETITKGTPLSNTSETPWPVHVPNPVYVDESGVPYGIAGRSTQAPVNPPLPVGHNAPHHGMQFPTAIPSPLSTPLNNNLPSALQPMPYIPPPLPAGRPTTPHASSLPVNPAHQQQQLHLHFQQQNAMKLQQQQLQSRQHQLMHHAQPQPVQQLHHQQHLLGPLPMQGQVPLPPPPPVPQTPAPIPPIPAPPQAQQRSQQQESSAMLQQMLASPEAIQALLKDQNKLRELLEKHPKLISLLQERMSGAS